MTREIKFRGKTKERKWVIGSYFCMHHNDERNHIHHFIIPENTPIPKNKTIGEIQVEVQEDTIGQFTGLHDKNGKEIYEGDIVYIRMNDGSDCHCVIGYDIDNLAFGIMDEYAYRSMLDGYKWNYDNRIMHRLYKDSRIFEIVGNIYDNPELLKEE